jgi:hypothetical protein
MTEEATLVPPTEEAKPKKKAKAKAKAEAAPKKVRRSKFAELYPDEMALQVLVEENPKKEGSKARAMFEGYFGTKTVGEARANGVSYQSIAYDIGRGFIKLG